MRKEKATNNYLPLEWMPKAKLDSARSTSIKNNIDQFLRVFQTSEHFSKFSPEIKYQGAELIARFFFGVQIVYSRLGFKYPIYRLIYDTGREADYSLICHHYDKNSYVVNVSDMISVLDAIQNSGNCLIDGAGLRKSVPARDFFEIAGVEEAAHLLYYNEKKKWDKKVVNRANPKYKYFTSNAESRALLWKLAYVKRYMPEYYDSLKLTYKKTKTIRLKSIKNK